jgi:exodeoxyribonuclease VII small subunit
MPKTVIKSIEQLTYEEAYGDLERIVAALEEGDQPLEEALALFERGQLLTKHCADLLAKAELKVQELSGETLEPYEEGE